MIESIYNEEAEKSVLGVMLGELGKVDIISRTLEALTPEDFYLVKHRIIYRAIQELHRAGKGVDTITVNNHLTEAGDLENAGGTGYLMELTGAIPTTAHQDSHIKIIQEKTALRRLKKTLTEMTQCLAVNPGVIRETLDKLKDQAEAQARELDRSGGAVPSMRDVLMEVEEAIFQKKYKPIPTFSDEINWNLNGGLQRGKVFTIAGKAGGGKTTLALQMMDEIAQGNAKKPAGGIRDICVYVHLEQGRPELLIKSFSRLGQVNSGQFERGEIGPEAEEVKAARGTYARDIAPYLYIIEAGEGSTVRAIRALIRKISSQIKDPHQVVLCVDPFQRLRTGDRSIDGDEIQRVGAVASGLKILARDLQVAVILLSDTSKEAAKTMEKGNQATGSIRGSYMAEHTTDISATIFTGGEEEEAKGVWGTIPAGKLRTQVGKYIRDISGDYPVYACLAFSKNRSGATSPAYFLYKKALQTFIPLEKLTEED